MCVASEGGTLEWLQLVAESRAPSTFQSYRGWIVKWQMWARGEGFLPEAPPPGAFPVFLSTMVTPGSMGVAAAAVSWFWKLRGTVQDPQSAFLTSLVIRGGGRSKGPASRMEPLSVEEVHSVLLMLEKDGALCNLRLMALIAVVFFWGLANRGGVEIESVRCDVCGVGGEIVGQVGQIG